MAFDAARAAQCLQLAPSLTCTPSSLAALDDCLKDTAVGALPENASCDDSRTCAAAPGTTAICLRQTFQLTTSACGVGICRTKLLTGEECGPNGTPIPCENGYCSDPQPGNRPTTCRPYGALGDFCAGYGECLAPLYCDAYEEGACSNKAAHGGHCTAYDGCADPTDYCDGTLTCKTAIAPGQACVTNGVSCQNGLTCYGGVCVPSGGAPGELCNPAVHRCAERETCLVPDGGFSDGGRLGLCSSPAPYSGLSQPCSTEADCGGLYLCSNHVCVPFPDAEQPCDQGRCRQDSFCAGGTCHLRDGGCLADEPASCGEGTYCHGGACVPVKQQGEACDPAEFSCGGGQCNPWPDGGKTCADENCRNSGTGSVCAAYCF